jgi:hypothetical protein
MMDVALVFSGMNSAVLVALVFLYGRMALKSRAVQSFALIVFALFLLAQNLLTIYAYDSMAPLFGTETVPYLTAIAGSQFVALSVLLRFTI